MDEFFQLVLAQRALQQEQDPETSDAPTNAHPHPFQNMAFLGPTPSNGDGSTSINTTARQYYRAVLPNGGAGIAFMPRGSPDQRRPPQVRNKAVCCITCKYCHTPLCFRGMKAILLADMNVELYSTDCAPKHIQLVNEDYTTSNCECRIKDIACLGCGQEIGYHVVQPCDMCLHSANNGHFWMFSPSDVVASDRVDPMTGKVVSWAALPHPTRDPSMQGEAAEDFVR